MATKRINRLNELIKREVSQLFIREIDLPKDVLVTITRVQTSPDLSQAKIYVSVIPEEYFSRTIKILNSQIFYLQKRINQLLTIKKAPRLKLIEERTTREADKIEKILEKIKKES